jgi:hypothetical protein
MGVLLQANRKLQLIVQRLSSGTEKIPWRPSVISISESTLESRNTLELLEWISYRFGFATYLHFMEDSMDSDSLDRARSVKKEILKTKPADSRVYIDTIVSSSYSFAISQAVQFPGISGMPNNLIVFEDRRDMKGYKPNAFFDNIRMAFQARLDILVYSFTSNKINFKAGIDVWLDSSQLKNTNLMILLSYIILGHPVWQNSEIRIFELVPSGKSAEYKKNRIEVIRKGQIPVTEENIEMIELSNELESKGMICTRSSQAGLVVLGFSEEDVRFNDLLFSSFSSLNHVVFVNAADEQKID